MDFFTLRPNYIQLIKYVTFDVPNDIADTIQTDAQLLKYFQQMTDEHAIEGIQIGIESYVDNNNKVFFDQSHINQITIEFEELLKEYKLLNHRDNLLWLIANQIQSTNSYYDYLQFENYNYMQRMKELAGYLLAFKDKPNAHRFEIQLKVYDKKNGVLSNKVLLKDQLLLRWMGQLASDIIDSGQAPTYLFGMHENAVNRRKENGPASMRELKDAASFKNSFKSYKKTNKILVNLCLLLQDYLNEHTYLKVRNGVKSNDKQLLFLYKVCLMFGVSEKDFDVQETGDPVRYMRQTMIDNTPPDIMVENPVKSF